MLTVAHLYKDFPPIRGGIESHIDVLTRLLVERGVGVEVYCSRPPGTLRRERRGGVQIRRCAAPLTLASTPITPGLPWTLRASEAQIVHLHHPWPPADVAWLLGARGRPLVVTFHCEVIRYPGIARVVGPLTRRLLSAARAILVSSTALRTSAPLVPHTDRVRVVPFGVDLSVFRPDPSARDPLPSLPYPRILFVGRLRRYKGLDVLAAALARLPSAHLVVAGEGPERNVLETALRAQGCRDRCQLLGEVDDGLLLRLMQTSDAAVLPSTSRAEAFGLSMAEAQACGVPAVVTDVGTGTTEVVRDGVSGRVVPPADAQRLAEAISWCIDPLRQSTLGAAARAHAEAALDGRRMAARVRDIYEEVAAGKRARDR